MGGGIVELASVLEYSIWNIVKIAMGAMRSEITEIMGGGNIVELSSVLEYSIWNIVETAMGAVGSAIC